MELILKDNALLSLGSTISANIKDNCTSAFIKNCPNVLGINVLRQCVNLTRVRIDIGNATGTLKEICAYAQMNGFDDNGNEQTKPRIVGTFTITDYCKHDIAAYLEDSIDGITIDVAQTAVDIDDAFANGDFALHTIDSTDDAYNPAAAIVMDNIGWGYRLYDPVEEKTYWFITKTDASAKSVGTQFNEVETVADANLIVPESHGDPTSEYDFTDAMWLEHFANTSVPLFKSCTKLEYVKLPSRITSFGDSSRHVFQYCTSLKKVFNIENIINTDVSLSAFRDCEKFEDAIINFQYTNTGNTMQGYFGEENSTVLYTKNITRELKLTFKNIIALGNASQSTRGTLVSAGKIKTNYIYVHGNAKQLVDYYNSTTMLKMVEINGTLTGKCFNRLHFDCKPVVHLLYEGVATNVTTYALRSKNQSAISPTNSTDVYVGDGSSQAHDEAIRQQYLAIADWQPYENHILLWYDYLQNTDRYKPDVPQWAVDMINNKRTEDEKDPLRW